MAYMAKTGIVTLCVYLFINITLVLCTKRNETCADQLDRFESQLEKYREQVTRLEDTVQHLVSRGRRSPHGIAFTAIVSANSDVNSGEPVIFDRVLLNDGHAYNPQSGIFTAGVDGVFFFTFTFKATAIHQQLWLVLLHNGNQVTAGASDVFHDNQDVQGGNSAVIHLAHGDTVWLEIMHVTHARIHGTAPFSSFSGIWQY